MTEKYPGLFHKVIKGNSYSLADNKSGDELTRILATGTFDILHPGHLYYLEQARKYGSELYVLVARDSTIEHKPKPIVPEKQRLEMVKALKVVDHALLGSEEDMFKPLEEVQPDIIVLGHDQVFDEKELEDKLQKRGFKTKVVRLGKPRQCPLCSSGRIIKRILERKRTEL
ncbi:MAG: FAD synthetase [Methanohalophilus sp. T328-1]|uniref:FAD synthase n=1 Tax=Methanohalophilus euhalobius TaxID=51203 RepID=A0A315A1P1_9EURY|nr:MAG: FAD synthetase [Methanohalophilus sp. T328-1]PQV43477.1 FAD synthetase [Methanohalophilus euhalobius]RSD33510.1 MAG: FAD synthetase [Methanohalophilus sp.]RXG33847.1 FAD synthetase [Methanohalophilus sp. WG1-DM]